MLVVQVNEIDFSPDGAAEPSVKTGDTP